MEPIKITLTKNLEDFIIKKAKYIPIQKQIINKHFEIDDIYITARLKNFPMYIECPGIHNQMSAAYSVIFDCITDSFNINL